MQTLISARLIVNIQEIMTLTWIEKSTLFLFERSAILSLLMNFKVLLFDLMYIILVNFKPNYFLLVLDIISIRFIEWYGFFADPLL